MRGFRKVQKAKPPRPRKGLDHPSHLSLVKAQPCILKGKRGVIRKWVGVYPNAEEIEIEVQHFCWSASSRDAHHVVRKSQRGSDLDTVPLCRDGHALVHSMGQAEVEIVFDVDFKAEAKRCRRLSGTPKGTP